MSEEIGSVLSVFNHRMVLSPKEAKYKSLQKIFRAFIF